ncbi:hypothetical protein PsAD2_02086 [Pseudovibrio axinellae]|uniref:Uncharacterized protein n=1 Tax=Pseudovibrio axinellae TaxID=989403 RepID=A0A165YXZ7_9HYPH|nr:hypothetical protein PsAD2_02086 [Pseudovibrio axinellae]SEQ40921.1 hypothetical protein SAMN05421798_102621 [Pseudovibrio axinellae]
MMLPELDANRLIFKPFHSNDYAHVTMGAAQ